MNFVEELRQRDDLTKEEKIQKLKNHPKTYSEEDREKALKIYYEAHRVFTGIGDMPPRKFSIYREIGRHITADKSIGAIQSKVKKWVKDDEETRYDDTLFGSKHVLENEYVGKLTLGR